MHLFGIANAEHETRVRQKADVVRWFETHPLYASDHEPRSDLSMVPFDKSPSLHMSIKATASASAIRSRIRGQRSTQAAKLTCGASAHQQTISKEWGSVR